MLNFFKKKNKQKESNNPIEKDFDIELTASFLAYEIARSDGNVSETELSLLLDQIKKISLKVEKTEKEILDIIETYSNESASFYDFISDINKFYSKEDKLSLIRFLFDIAYADNVLEVNEERLVRRIADLIKIKNIEVLRLKDISKKNKPNNL